jgi:ABC-type transport system involved in cytochrome c biogenesis permease subunit
LEAVTLVNALPVTIALYFLATVWLWSKRPDMRIGWLLLGAAGFSHISLGAGGWLLKGVPPVAGAQGFLLVVAWLVVLLALALVGRNRGRERFVGSASALAAILLVATGFFPGSSGELPAALRSPWFPVHVSLTALGEATIGVGFLAAMLGLMRRGRVDGRRGTLLVFCLVAALVVGTVTQGVVVKAGALEGVTGASLRARVLLGILACGGPLCVVFWLLSGRLATRAPAEADLVDVQLRSVRLGYALFSLGAIAAGMAWARSAWGSWWSWDPKETASLVVWLMLTVHLHVGPRLGWRSLLNRALLIATFLACLANLVGTFGLGGLHSYG